MKLKLFTVFVLLITTSALTASSQCNVKGLEKNGVYNASTNFEKLYQNEDLENGFRMYHSRVNMKCDGSTSYTLEVSYSSSIPQQEVKPRILVITFLNGGSIELGSYKEEILDVDSRKPIYSYLFELSEESFSKLSTSPVTEITFVDTKARLRVTTSKAYQYVFYEAIGCLKDWAKKNVIEKSRQPTRLQKFYVAEWNNKSQSYLTGELIGRNVTIEFTSDYSICTITYQDIKSQKELMMELSRTSWGNDEKRIYYKNNDQVFEFGMDNENNGIVFLCVNQAVQNGNHIAYRFRN